MIMYVNVCIWYTTLEIVATQLLLLYAIQEGQAAWQYRPDKVSGRTSTGRSRAPWTTAHQPASNYTTPTIIRHHLGDIPTYCWSVSIRVSFILCHSCLHRIFHDWFIRLASSLPLPFPQNYFWFGLNSCQSVAGFD